MVQTKMHINIHQGICARENGNYGDSLINRTSRDSDPPLTKRQGETKSGRLSEPAGGQPGALRRRLTPFLRRSQHDAPLSRCGIGVPGVHCIGGLVSPIRTAAEIAGRQPGDPPNRLELLTHSLVWCRCSDRGPMINFAFGRGGNFEHGVYPADEVASRRPSEQKAGQRPQRSDSNKVATAPRCATADCKVS